MVMALLRIILILVLFTACRSEYSCPPPNSVRLKRMSAHRMKYYKFQMQERAMARERNAEYNQLRKYNEREEKNINEVKPINVNEWDCPKPGTAHQRQILKQRKKLEKQNEDYLRKRLEKQEIVLPENSSGSTPKE